MQVFGCLQCCFCADFRGMKKVHGSQGWLLWKKSKIIFRMFTSICSYSINPETSMSDHTVDTRHLSVVRHMPWNFYGYSIIIIIKKKNLLVLTAMSGNANNQCCSDWLNLHHQFWYDTTQSLLALCTCVRLGLTVGCKPEFTQWNMKMLCLTLFLTGWAICSK